MNEEINNNLTNQNMELNQQVVSSENVTPNIEQTGQANNVAPTTASNGEKPPIIVNGIDVSKISAFELDEDLIDEMTEEQADLYLEGKSEAEIAAFNEKNGFSVSMVLSDEELAKREAERAGLSINVGKPQNTEPSTPVEPLPTKTEQTGSVIFGVKK